MKSKEKQQHKSAYFSQKQSEKEKQQKIITLNSTPEPTNCASEAVICFTNTESGLMSIELAIDGERNTREDDNLGHLGELNSSISKQCRETGLRPFSEEAALPSEETVVARYPEKNFKAYSIKERRPGKSIYEYAFINGVSRIRMNNKMTEAQVDCAKRFASYKEVNNTGLIFLVACVSTLGAIGITALLLLAYCHQRKKSEQNLPARQAPTQEIQNLATREDDEVTLHLGTELDNDGAPLILEENNQARRASI